MTCPAHDQQSFEDLVFEAEQTAANVQAMLYRLAAGTTEEDSDTRRCFKAAAQLLQVVLDPLGDILERLLDHRTPPGEEVQP